MRSCDTLIRNANVVDGSRAVPSLMNVAINGDPICEVGPSLSYDASAIIDAQGLALAPGVTDVHKHDDTAVIHDPVMLPKLSQGITTVIVGNCGISAAPVHLRGEPPDPMNLLGNADAFRYPTFARYIAAIQEVIPAVNVGAL